jgi:catechol 2,3-dioxygenase-like lactoylglutathione lyase family enzyme
MPKPIVGLHHVTAIASDPQRNLDFYMEVLGLRFIKRTINFTIRVLITSTSATTAAPPAPSSLSSLGRELPAAALASGRLQPPPLAFRLPLSDSGKRGCSTPVSRPSALANASTRRSSALPTRTE